MGTSSTNFGLTLEQRNAASIQRFLTLKQMIFQEMHCALPGVVLSFDPGPPATVNVQLVVNRRKQTNETPKTLGLKTQFSSFPILQNVPISIPSGGVWSLTFPIKPGDECEVIFNDMAIDNWFHAGGIVNPTSPRNHDLTDAIAIFGLRSTPRALYDYSPDTAQLRNDDGTVVIDMAAGQVTITAPNVTVNCTDMTANCSGKAEISAGTVAINGNTEISAIASTVVLGTSAKSRDFLTHFHTSAASGSPTGPVL